MKTYRQCQSCGMPLVNKQGDHHAAEKDGTPADRWCNLCYKDGEFIGGDCSLDEMRAIVDKALKDSGHGRIMRWMAQKQLPTLERWKSVS